MKHSDYLKKKKARETRKKIISVIAAFVVFVTTYALVLPAITLDVSRANKEPGIAFEQMQFKASASAAAVTAAENTEEDAAVEAKAEDMQVEETKEAPAKEEAPAEEPAPAEETEVSEEEPSAEAAPAEEVKEESASEETAAEEATVENTADQNADNSAVMQEDSHKDTANDVETSESASDTSSVSDPAETADAAAVDQTGTEIAETAESSETAATEEAAAEFKVPELDALDFDDILTGKTDFYFYHVEDADEAENLSSDSIDDWKKVGSDTVLAPEDFVRVYLSYEIPAGALNETNTVARYTLPKGMELTDKQIKAINKYENGIAAAQSGSDHDKYLGAEAIEGTRTPDEKAGDEYISATVKIDKVYKNGEDRQELVFTFIPYTVEKNQISYDKVGEVTSEGKKVKGFFTFDLTTSQIDFEKTNIETVENEDGTTEEIQYSEAEVDFTKDIDRALTLAAPVENEEKEEKTLNYAGPDYNVTITYTDDTQIPDNAELAVSEIAKDTEEYAAYLEQAQGAVDEAKSVNEARFFDITILVNGEKIEPQAPVNVQITFAGIEQTDTDDTQLLHYKDNDEVEVIDKAEFSKSEEQTVDTVQFETDGFSVFAVVGTEELKTQYITADGKNYSITVTYGPKAEIPSNATLSVREIQRETDEYFEYYNKALRAAGLILTDPDLYNETVLSTESTVEVHEIIPFMPDARFFDVSIMVDGSEFEPKDTVEVKVEYDDSLKMGSNDKVSSVHFTDNGDEIIDAEISEESNRMTVTHPQDGFSATGDIVISMTGDADPDDPDSKTADFEPLQLRASGTNNGPVTTKTVTDNGNGTYKIKLDIVGAVETHTDVTKANVIIILDTSGSMDETASGSGWSSRSRWDYAEAAVNSVASTLLGKNGQGDNPNDLIEMALVTFSTTASTRVAKTTKASDISNALSRISPDGGTNWEDALQEVANINFNNDGDATYVIFVSDGNPTFRNTKGSYDRYFNVGSGWNARTVDDWGYYNTWGVYGSGSDDYAETVRRCYNEALDDAQALVNSGRQLYTIGAFGNVDRMQSLTTGAGAPANHYYSASDADALSQALNEIADAITNSIDFQNVSTTDGVTPLSNLDAKVSGEATGFKYYKNGTEWANAPAAKYENSSVVWDLSSENPLEDQTTYSIEFDVWPSQAAYDTVADLNNGKLNYDTLDDNIKSQIQQNNDGTYSLKTNTSLTTTYTKDGVSDTDTWDHGSNAMKLDASTIHVQKLWNNDLDNRDAGTGVTSIALKVTKDGAEYVPATVTKQSDNTWKSGDIYISCGLITQTGTSYTVKETGHDYSVIEPDEYAYYWDLTSDIYRPMVINGTPEVLVRDDTASGTDGTDYYTLTEVGGTTTHRYIKRSGSSFMEAKNDRRSNLNLTKNVTDHSVDHGVDVNALFQYTITIGKAGEDDIWFSAQDSSGATITELTTTATPEVKDGAHTGYYYVEAGTEFTVSMKAGWNIRFINQPTGTEYSIVESNMPSGFTYTSATSAVTGDGTKATITDSEKKAAGTIDKPNNSYSVTYNNDWSPTNKLTVTKEWKSGTFVTQHGDIQIALFKSVDGTLTYIEGTLQTISTEANASSKSYTFNKLSTLDNVVLREATVTTEGETTKVTPIDDGNIMAVSGETTTVGNNATDTYIVTYTEGVASDGERADKITNTMPQLVVNKNDAESNRLADAVFKLTDKDGNTIKDNITSTKAENGNLLDGIYLSNGTYYLVETIAPDGYNKLTYKIKLTVTDTSTAATVITAVTDPESTINISDETSDNKLVYTFTVHNSDGTELPMTGGPGSFIYTLSGMLLLIASAMMYGFRMRRRERRLR